MTQHSGRTDVSRRSFIARLGGTVLGVALTPLAGCETNMVAPFVEGTDIPFLTPLTDPNPDRAFYVQYGADGTVTNWPGPRQIARDAWTLTVDGLVPQPRTFTYADIQRLSGEAIRIVGTLRCIVDSTFVPGLIGTTLFTGIPLRLLLQEAGVDAAATRRLRIYGADGFTNNLRILEAMGPFAPEQVEPLLVYQMGDAALTPDHGFPVRLVVPGQYGYKSVKWINRIEATASDAAFGSYQDVLGYTDDGRVQVVNKATNPLRNAQISAGTTTIFGYAMSGMAGISRVEISIDDAPFTPVTLVDLPQVLSANPSLRATLQVDNASLYPYPFRGVWTLWEYPWTATAGAHTIRVRAIDRAGNTQPDTDDVVEDGENPVFRISVTVA
ncbi:MAG: molybdopterin-dependent oxidoreductase [Rhodothermales bacterium]